MRVLAARGEAGAALAALERVLESRPGDERAWLLRGALLLETREEAAALAAFGQAARRAPASAEALNGLARCLHAAGRDAEALQVAERARDCLERGDNYVQTGPVYLTLVWCLRELRQLREALAMAEQGLARCDDAVLAQWAATVEEELAEAERERC